MKTLFLLTFIGCSSAQVALGQQAGTASQAPATDRFHQLLARSTGAWTGQATMTFSPTAPPITSTSTLTNTMAMGGLFQVSEIIYTIGGQRLRGIRVTGYDASKKIFTRAMIQDGGNGVAMEGPWDEATHSMTMRYQQLNSSTGRVAQMKEVYTIVDENTELLEIYRQGENPNQETKILHVKWTRNR